MAIKKKIRRILKTIAWILSCLIGMVLLLILSLWFFFPEKKVFDIVMKQSAANGWPIRIQSASWGPLGRIDLKGIDVSFQPDSSSSPIPFFKMNRLAVRFRLVPLLRRELSISEVILDRPNVFLSADFLKGLQTLAAKQPPKKTEQKPLPVDMGIQKLTLHDFNLTAALPEPSLIREIRLEGLNLDVSKFQIPSHFLTSPQDFRGCIHLFSEKGRISFAAMSREYVLDPNIDLVLEWGKKGLWTVHAETDIRSANDSKERIVKVMIEAAGKGYAENVRIDRAEVYVGSQKAAEIQGSLSQTGREPEFHLAVTGSPLSAEEIQRLLVLYLPDTLADFIKPLDVEGKLTLAFGRISGDLKQFRFRLSSDLKGLNLENPLPRFHLEQAAAILSAEGSGDAKGMRDTEISGSVTLPMIQIYLNDTVSSVFKQASLELKTRLNGSMMPAQGGLTGAIQDLFGGKLQMDANWEMKASSPAKIDDLKARVSLAAEGLDLHELPGASAGIEGKANVRADLKLANAEDITIDLKCDAQKIGYLYQGEPEKLPPLEADAMMFWHAENNFRKWILDSTSIRALDVFTANLTGGIDLEKREFVFKLQDGSIRNSVIPGFFPQKLKDQLEGVEIHGNERLEVTVRSLLEKNSLSVDLVGALRIQDGGIVLPMQSLRVEGVQGEIGIAGSPEKLSGAGAFQIDSVFFEKLRTRPIAGSRVEFRWAFSVPDRLEFQDGRIEVPDLSVNGEFHGLIDRLSTIPQVLTRADFQFFSSDTISLTSLLAVKGRLKGWVAFESIPPENRLFRLSGEADVDSLSLFGKPMLEIRNAQGKIPFSLGIDPQKGGLAASGAQKPFDRIAYGNQRSLFKAFFPALSDFHIEKILVAGYSLDDLNLDVLIQDGLVQVPWFQGRLLGGNLGGGLWLELNDGQPYSMTYSLHANAGRINSANLLKSGVLDEDTELDATLAFDGKGLDPKTGLDVEGALHITKIGPKFASTMLQGIDPQGTDRSIRLTRRLFDLWYKPKLFSFELRHGYVYPSLLLSQPWFSPLRIPDKVEYGRLPLEFFLKNPMIQTKQ